jgi:hypothetical protein
METIASTLRSLAVEASQRRVARHGVPRLADTGSRGRGPVAAGAAQWILFDDRHTSKTSQAGRCAMPIDMSKGVLFVHIPKTGGTTICALLGLFGTEHFHASQPLPKLSPNYKSPQHFTYRELCRNLSADFCARAYKIAFVRNPWDRFVSEFCWRKNMYMCRRSIAPQDLYYSEADLTSLETFARLLELPRRQREDCERGLDGHLETQRSYLVNEEDRIAVDFLGRFERFETDVRRMMAHLNLPLDKGCLTGLMRGDRLSNYRPYYSNRTRKIVENHYAEDIREFGYSY